MDHSIANCGVFETLFSGHSIANYESTSLAIKSSHLLKVLLEIFEESLRSCGSSSVLHLSAEQRGESETPYCVGNARLAVEIVFAIQRILKFVAANFPN